MYKHLKLLTTSLSVALTLTSSQAMDNPSSFEYMQAEVKGQILTSAITPYVELASRGEMSYTDFLSKVSFCTFRLFSQNQDRSESDKATLKYVYSVAFSNAYGVDKEDYKDCLTFLNGKLCFMKDAPNQFEFKIADQLNPFRCQFDLSKCVHPQGRSMDQYLRIGTGYRDGSEEKMSKADINIVPLFWIKKELREGRAQHLSFLYLDADGNWKPNAPIALYMAWGRDRADQFACITTLDNVSLSSKSIWDNFCTLPIYHVWLLGHRYVLHDSISYNAYQRTQAFHVHLN